MLARPIVDTEICDGCEECVEQCPQDIFAIVDGKAQPVHAPEECIDCDVCLAACTSDAITVEKPDY